MLQRAPRTVEGTRCQLRQDTRLILRSALREDGRACGETVDHDHRKRSREGDGGGGERQEDLQTERQPAAPRFDQPRDRQRDADEEDDCERGEQFLAA